MTDSTGTATNPSDPSNPSDSAQLHSPLHDWHLEHGAKMADFGGWDMPIEYAGGGVVAEHTAVRERVGIFDVSHLGKASVTGRGAADFVNRCFTNDLRRIEPGRAQYTLCCTDQGGVVDDLIQYFRSEDDVFLVPNAANTAAVVDLLKAHAQVDGDGLTIENRHRDYGVIAVQGPRSDELLDSLGLPTGMPYMAFEDATWQGRPVTVCRTGYTGERGYELLPTWDDTPTLWNALVDALDAHEGRVCGLGARDTLRTEMGYALHGHELSTEITPVQARVGWAVGWKKETFWGREALLAEKADGPPRTAWGLLLTGRGIPRADCVVRRSTGSTGSTGSTDAPAAGGAEAAATTPQQVGIVTSGTFSPTRREGIALALIDSAAGLGDGDEVVVDVRGRLLPAVLQRPPFVPSHTSD